MTLLEYRTRILDAIGDPTKARYSDAVTAEGLRLALEEYSKANPQIKETTITVVLAGRDQVLTGVLDLLYQLCVLFPVTLEARVTADSAPEIESYYFYTRDGLPWVTISQPADVPQPGQDIKILYGAPHTIQDLDAALADTVPAVDMGLLVLGAAGHAMTIRADSIVESYGKRTPQEDVYKSANRRLTDFRRRLRAHKGPEGMVAAWVGGWKLDQWDQA
jgi:hypothetical protein